MNKKLKIIVDLRKQYKKETGYPIFCNKKKTIFTFEYVEWLENRLNKMDKEKNCKHCEFIKKLDDIYRLDEKGYKDKNIKSKQTNKLWYYLMTEIFVYLHNGKDYCKEI